MAFSRAREADGRCGTEAFSAGLLCGLRRWEAGMPWMEPPKTSGMEAALPLRPSLGGHTHDVHHIVVVEELASVCPGLRRETTDPASP